MKWIVVNTAIRSTVPSRMAEANVHKHGAGIEVQSASPEWVSLSVPCDLALVDDTLAMLEPRGSNLERKIHDELCTAVREMLMNAIEHGGGNDPSKSVKLDCVMTPTQILVHIEDPGPGFGRTDLKHAAVGNPENGTQLEHLEIRQAAGIRPGGYGMLMASQMVDQLIYNERGNEVLLIKSLPKREAKNL